MKIQHQLIKRGLPYLPRALAKPASRWVRPVAIAAMCATAAPASAELLDHGPGDPTLLFPTWYRDLTGNAVGLCKSQTPSPNPLSGGRPFCFPFAPDPAGFAGNVGPEIFYNVLNIVSKKNANGFDFRYLAGLEASYLPLGVPVHGTETIFARIRIGVSFTDPALNGTYRFTHPFGVNTFDITASTSNAVFGAHASLFFTFDVPLGIPNDFNSALGGPIGPWIQWDVINPGETLAGTDGSQFLGDSNYDHTFTGSPFITPASVAANYPFITAGQPQNYLLIERIDANGNVLPDTGTNTGGIDGVGHNWIFTNVGAVLGQKWLAPIAQPLTVTQANFSRRLDGTNAIDVWARSTPNQKVVLTGTGIPSLQMFETANQPGLYHGHVEGLNMAIPPQVTVSNASSIPVISVDSAVTDSVDIHLAGYDNVTRQLLVLADSTDEVGQPALEVEGIPGVATATMHKQSEPNFATDCPIPATVPPIALTSTDQCYSIDLPLDAEPPASLLVHSASLGVHAKDVDQYLRGGPGVGENATPAPVAADDTQSVPNSGTTVVAVLANDTPVAGAGSPTVLIISPPALGTAVVNADGTISYTPSGTTTSGTDSFKYVIQQGTPVKVAGSQPAGGAISNVATVNITQVFTPMPPSGGNDQFAAQSNNPTVPNKLNVLANDKATVGTSIVPGSVAIAAQGTRGTAAANPDGTITYTPNPNTGGTIDTFTYTVKNDQGQTSAPIPVTMTIFSSPESISYQKSQYTTGKWTIVGTTSWFGPQLTQTKVNCWLVASNNAAVNPPKLVSVDGPVAVDSTGKFQVAPVGTTPAPVNPATISCTTTNNGSKAQSVTIK